MPQSSFPRSSAARAALSRHRRLVILGLGLVFLLSMIVPLFLSAMPTGTSGTLYAGLDDAMAVVTFVGPTGSTLDGLAEGREARTLLANSWKYSKEAATNRSFFGRRVDLLIFADLSHLKSNIMQIDGCKVATSPSVLADPLTSLSSPHGATRGLCAVFFFNFAALAKKPHPRFAMLLSPHVIKFVTLYGLLMLTEPDTMVTPKLFSYTPEVPLVMGHAVGGDDDMWSALVNNNRNLAEWLRGDTTSKWFGHYLGTLGTWVGSTSTILAAAARVVRAPQVQSFSSTLSLGRLLELWHYGRAVREAITSQLPEKAIAQSPLLDVPCDSNTRDYIHLHCGHYQETLNPKALVISRGNFRSRRFRQMEVPVTHHDARGTAARYALFIVMRQHYTHRDLLKPSKRMRHGDALLVSAPPGGDAASSASRSWVGPDAIAIVGYVPGGKYVKELNAFLEPSWHFARTNYTPEGFRGHGEPRKRCDLIVVVSPEVKSPPGCKRVNVGDGKDGIRKALESPLATSGTEIPGVCLVIEYPVPSDSIWKKHKNEFMFSLSFVDDPRLRQMFLQYDRVLRTDVDVFVTTRLMLWRPEKPFVVGDGQYIQADYGRTRILEVSKQLSLRHHHLHNLGSTWFVPPQLLLFVMPLALEVAEEMLINEFSTNDVMNWPEWWVGVLSMYSSELAVNHLIKPEEVQIERRMLDVNSTLTDPFSIYPPHIHCWPMVEDTPFSKKAYHADKYKIKDYPLAKLEPNSKIRDYAFYIALHYSQTHR